MTRRKSCYKPLIKIIPSLITFTLDLQALDLLHQVHVMIVYIYQLG